MPYAGARWQLLDARAQLGFMLVNVSLLQFDSASSHAGMTMEEGGGMLKEGGAAIEKVGRLAGGDEIAYALPLPRERTVVAENVDADVGHRLVRSFRLVMGGPTFTPGMILHFPRSV